MRCGTLLVVVLVAMGASAVHAEILPNGVLDDEQMSIVYYPETGEVAIDAPASNELRSVNLDSASGIFTGDPPLNIGETFAPNDDPHNIFKATFGSSFGSLTFGTAAQPGLPHDFMVDDLTVIGSLLGDVDLGDVDLVYMHELLPGDADRNLRCDQLDFVQVLQRGKYLTGQPATWGAGDWDGAPGGYPGNPPQGNGLFDQLDIISVLGDGCPYLTGPYAAISPGGIENDEQTSITYDARTGEIAVDAPASTELTSVIIESAAGLFQTCSSGFSGRWCEPALFKATFGSSFGSLSFGNVAQAGLSEQFVADDLTVVGSLSGGGDLGPVDLIFIPEPSSVLLTLLGVVGLLHWRRWRK